jgi:hypothetical protein
MQLRNEQFHAKQLRDEQRQIEQFETVENTQVGINAYMVNDVVKITWTIRLIVPEYVNAHHAGNIKKWTVVATRDHYVQNLGQVTYLGEFPTFFEAAKTVIKKIAKIKTNDPSLYPVYFSYLSAGGRYYQTPLIVKDLAKKKAMAYLTNEVTVQQRLLEKSS